jgi:hypothetical protein
VVKILGLCGKKGVGKDTAAEILLDKGWARISFADPLKELCAAVFDIKPAKFFHPEFKDLVFEEPIILGRDHADNFIAALDRPLYGHAQSHLIYDAFEGKEINTARELLQFIGTDVVRNCVSTTYWVDLAEKRLQRWVNDGVSVVFTDVRMPNERDLVKDYGGVVARITRDVDNADNHASELQNFKVDCTIGNNGSIEDLHHLIKEVV